MADPEACYGGIFTVLWVGPLYIPVNPVNTC